MNVIRSRCARVARGSLSLGRLTLLAQALTVAPALVAQPRDSVTPAPVVMWRDVGVLAGGAVLATLFQRADLSARREVRSAGWQQSGLLGAASDLGNPWGDPGAVIAGIGLWAGGRLTDRPVVAAVGFRAIEAITVSGWITLTLKGAFGRARPRVSPDDAWDVDFGRGFSASTSDYQAMPSGHATTAFAFAAAATSELARRDHPRTMLVGVTTYSLATMTAYARMHRDAHWLSDVTMGAAIGVASAHAITRWHATRPGNRLDAFFLGAVASPFVAPGPRGSTLLGATITWR